MVRRVIQSNFQEFPVICDDAFLKRVQNSHLELKLWEKTGATTEKLIGVAKVPLHQFYIAFKDKIMIEHLSTNKLPIISIDGFTNFVSPLSSEFCSQVRILLAIGNERQVDYLKATRNFAEKISIGGSRSNSAMQSIFEERNSQTQSRPNTASQRSEIKDRLQAFIDSLSNKLPDKSLPSITESKSNSIPKSPVVSQHSQSLPNSQLRKTSDLLESLQKALSQAPSQTAQEDFFSLNQESSNNHNESSCCDTTISQPETFRIMVEIEEAIHLPKVLVKKKRRNKNRHSQPQKFEIEPSAYTTFEAITNITEETKDLLPPNIIKSHEGFVYTTNVVEKSSNPHWNKKFDVYLDVDVMKNVS